MNNITRKNQYPLPLIGPLVDQLQKAKYFIKLNLQAGYNNVHIAEGHEWKTAFQMHCGPYKMLVMPFGLTNTLSAFQFFMNNIFYNLLDVCIVTYLDDILINSDNRKTHEEQVRKVL